MYKILLIALLLFMGTAAFAADESKDKPDVITVQRSTGQAVEAQAVYVTNGPSYSDRAVAVGTVALLALIALLLVGVRSDLKSQGSSSTMGS